MNKTCGNAITLKLTNLQPALKKVTDTKPALARFAVVEIRCFFGNVYSTNPVAFVLF